MMIIINYINENVVVSSNQLISGLIKILDEQDKQLLNINFNKQNNIQIPFDFKVNKIKVIIETKNNKIIKTFTKQKSKIL